MTGTIDVDAARRALQGVLDADASDARIVNAYASAVWSTLVEPGDGVAGALVGAFGAAGALDWALSETGRPRVGGVDLTALDLSGVDLDAARRRWRPRWGAVGRALDAARRARVRLVIPDDADWPRGLDDLGPHAPLCLWVRGTALPRQQSAVAIVGARAATPYGAHVATEIAAECARAGIVVVSGAAYGIDAAAHRAALHVGGSTVAVLAGGVDRPYPAGHDDLITQIATEGTVVSEVPCGGAPTKWRFLSRNRLIAALAGATVVVEAAHRSGALNTAHHAASLGRPLGAVPGPVTSAASAGCHRLLRETDAVCVTRGAEVRELLGDIADAHRPADGGADQVRTDDRTRVLDALSARPARTVLEVAQRCGMAPEEVAGHLGLLQLDEVVEHRDGGWRRRQTSTPARLW